MQASRLHTLRLARVCLARRSGRIDWDRIDPNRGSLIAELAAEFLETARHRRVAVQAATVRRHAIQKNAVPVSRDQRIAAVCTRGRSTLGVVDITGVDEFKAFTDCNGARASKRLRRRRLKVIHLPVRMKCGEMQRYRVAKFAADPL